MPAWGRLGLGPRTGGWSCWADLPRPAGRCTITCHSADAWPRFEAQLPTLSTPVPGSPERHDSACPIHPGPMGSSQKDSLSPSNTYGSLHPTGTHSSRLAPVGPTIRGAPGLTSSPPALAAMSCGDHPVLELLRPPRRPRTGWSVASASGLGQRQ